MLDSMPLRLMLTLAAVLPVASTASCPYIKGNEAQQAKPRATHPETIIEPRADEGASEFGRCPRKSNVAGGGTRSADWWPCELSLTVLRQHGEASDPFGADFDYPTEFAKLDVDELKKDLTKLQTDSQDWWPADFGDYGPFLIRLAWHSAGTYRQGDGRGGSAMGQQRFAPLNSWPDNANLDKARRLLWPIKQKYGKQISWADLIVLSGNLALENMGFPTYGFGFGREDTWQADEGIYWGSEEDFFPDDKSNSDRYNDSDDIYERADKLEDPLAAANMGLIYVDPRGPSGHPDPKASALDIRKTFGRMGMNDEETVALIAGGHAFGKTHGAVSGENIGLDPNAAGIEMQGFGWHNSVGDGNGKDSYTSGLEVIWSETPTKWANEFLHSLFTNEFSLVESPDGAPQWEAKNASATYPDAFIEGKFHKPRMLTSDLALIKDEDYRNISSTFNNNFDYFTEKFALAWYKLIHRDLGPISRYLGPDVPKGEPQLWQDPLPNAEYDTIDDDDVSQLKEKILKASDLNVQNLVTTAWGAASSFRFSDKRGGANGGRIALKPQRSFEANNPDRLETVLNALEKIQDKFNSDNEKKQVSLADLVVLGGTAAVEKAAKDAGMDVEVPFTPGRVDTTQDLTDIETFRFLEPKADGFRNYGKGNSRALTEELLIDRANLLSLSPPELTVLVGGMRALDANYDGSNHGILTNQPGKLTNDFFVNLLGMTHAWSPVKGSDDELFEAKGSSDKGKWVATRADLIFGSHPELRAIAEVYGSKDGEKKFANDFAKAWAKVMDLDRYDVKVSK